MSSLRVPFPVKVLISYLIVVSAGALPILIYLGQRFSHELTSYAAVSLVEHTRLISRTLTPLPVEKRLDQVRFLASTSLERFTYIDSEGFVLYDSEVSDLRKLGNHLDRPEIMLSLHRASERERFDPGIWGTGVARRLSESTGEVTLYAAASMMGAAQPADGEAPVHVLRLSLPVDEVESLSTKLEGVFRNSLALSVSTAIFLSLIAALVFMRPLQKVVATANALADGDYTALPPKLGNDEVGDVGRALQQLGVELRRRLAYAEAGNAMMTQLVETVRIPLALFDPDGVPVAINGPARELLKAVGEAEDDRIEAFVSHDGVRSAMERCVRSGLPVKLKIPQGADDPPLRGWVAPLERPDQRPFVAFMGRVAYRPAGSRLPKPSSVRVLQLADVVGVGLSRAAPILAVEDLSPPEPGEIPKAWVADAYGRLAMAVAVAAEEVARTALKAGVEGGSLEYTVGESAVVVRLPGPLGSEAVANLRMLLEPLGGEVKVDGSRADLILARA